MAIGVPFRSRDQVSRIVEAVENLMIIFRFPVCFV